MLYYVPLESYQERYTGQLSRAETGWLEAKWRKYGVEYKRIEGQATELPNKIKTGAVLDVTTRTRWAFRQVEILLHLMETGTITNADQIYFDDFWHPGIEQVYYLGYQIGVVPNLFSFLWAQSVDQYDFTHPMESWMRPFEKGIERMMANTFVASSGLRELLETAGFDGVCTVGLPFDSTEVTSNFVKTPPGPRRDKVIFSSRLDREKNPDFMLAVLDKVCSRVQTAQFVICTSADELRSNDARIVAAVKDMQQKHPFHCVIKTGLTKQQYYHELQTAKVQFNCANQDWVSYTLLEAVTAGAYPIYPAFRSFPEAIGRAVPMYRHLDVDSAVHLICDTLTRRTLWDKEKTDERWGRIVGTHDYTWLRMLEVMGVKHTAPVDQLYEACSEWRRHPYSDKLRESLVNQRKAVK